jgi:hypothetical protein
MRVVALAIAVALIGAACGGGSEEVASSPAQQADAGPSYPSPDCEGGLECYAQRAKEALARCPERNLDTTGRAARARLQRLLSRVDGVDLHNEQAYEAYEALGNGLAQFGRHCF